MNNGIEPRSRGKTLLIVEGGYEKEKLFPQLFRCFPELNLTKDRIIVYGTNLYTLHRLIKKEYGDDWESVDVDLPWLISDPEKRLYKADFVNVLLVFDYEHHDPFFSEETICSLQAHFCDATDMGKLYINYPMVESYAHLTALPDPEYETLKVPVTLAPGAKYKELVRELPIFKMVAFPDRLAKCLKDEYCIPEASCTGYADALLELSNPTKLEHQIHKILEPILTNAALERALHHLPNVLNESRHLTDGCTFWAKLRHIFSEIIKHNIRKANLIQNGIYAVEDQNLKDCFSSLDESKILSAQNNASRNPENGLIWVLNTCSFFVAEYNIELILPSDECE